jgi:PAS domain S-box-containing protein
MARLLHPDDIQSAEQRITEAIRDHVPLFNEYRIITPSGETRWIGAWGDTTYNERGEAQRMTGICIDITERKQMDEKLRASEEKFRMAFNTSPIAISIARLKGGGFVSINKSFEQMSGYSESEMIGKTAEELRFWKSPEVHQSLLKELHDKGEVRDYETPIQSRNGEIYCLTSASLIEINGEPHILTLAVDITERKQAREQLLQTMQELKRSNTELEQFAYIASHDLQEPLRAVAGMVQLLQKRYQGQLDQRADEYISLAIDGATRMQTLINDLLAYSRVERRGNPIQSIDANKSLASALRNLQISIAEQGATITNDPLPTLEADPTQLTQLFQNLIGNAIKFHGETPPQIHIAAEDLGEGWRFSVHDNGIGIEPQYFERVFLIFQRLHTRREYSGTGIGLSVCKKIVEWHGGRIWIESQIGRGSTFYFTIPHRSKP